MKYGGNLTCPSEWKVGQDTKLMMTLDRSTWPSVCRTDPDRREAWFEVIRWNDTGRQSVMCTVVNITSPGACQGNFTPGTIGCGCVSKTDEHFTLEFNFVMDFSSFGNWSVDTYCLRTDFSKPLQLEVAPECHVRLACENNTYGARCQESCGHCADDQTCNASTGHCLACTDGWLPPLCKQGCENKTYGARCQESCGHCADDQTCNTSTGHCPACLDDWLPPLCQEEAPAEEPLSPAVKIAIGVGVGAPASAVFFASLFQVCQFLSNMGYMPCISFGNKKEDTKTEEGGTDEGEKTEEEDETSDDAELSICSRCLTCMFCGGCVGSCLCCVTRGKMKSQGDVKLSEFPSDLGPVNNDTKEPITFERQERVASISEQADTYGYADSNLEKNHEAHNKTRRKSILERFFLIPKQAENKKKFIDNYFTTAEWLADPYKDPKRHNPTSWHRFYTSSVEMEKEPPRSSAFTFNSDELVGSETEGNAQKRRSSAFTSNSDELVGSKTEDISQAGQTIGKTQQGANTSLRRGSAQNEEQVNVIELMTVSEAEQGMSSVGQDGHFHDRSSESLEQPEQQEQTTGHTQSAGNSDKTVLEGEGSHRRTSQISGHSVDSGLS
ncbi:hypothetical protein V1264_017668 [Littorina saxatilis]|uniref:Uncharacterized protein n=1 Tax=Littorina saxatilis TaxID=31220 RepID=A0AAN9BJ47_9CAEN